MVLAWPERVLMLTLPCCSQASGFGQLKGGFAFECSLSLARTLLSQPPCPVLAALGRLVQFEIAVGMNGCVWVNSPQPRVTINVIKAITASEFLSEAQVHIMVDGLLLAK